MGTGNGQEGARAAAGDRQGTAQPSALLLIEDAEFKGELRTSLERGRWHVETCDCRAAALAALCERRSRVIVAECATAEEAAQLTRDAASAHPHAKVVFLAHAAIADAIAANNPDAYICLAKPVLPRVLLSVLNGAWRDGALAAHRHDMRRRIERRGGLLVGVLLPPPLVRMRLNSLADAIRTYVNDRIQPLGAEAEELK